MITGLSVKALYMQVEEESLDAQCCHSGEGSKSSHFEGVFFTDRISKVYGLWEGSEPLELLCYTRNEFDKKKKMIGTVREAVREGISVKV